MLGSFDRGLIETYLECKFIGDKFRMFDPKAILLFRIDPPF